MTATPPYPTTTCPPPYPVPLSPDGLAAVQRALPDRFVAAHPGYARIRPAFLPVVLPAGTTAWMQWATRHCLAAVTERVTAALAGGTIRGLLDDLGYAADESAWLSGMLDPATVAAAGRFARADFVLGRQGPRLVELNVGPAVGGIGMLDRYAQVAHDLLDQHVPGHGLAFPRPARAWAAALRATGRPATGRADRLSMVFVITDEDRAVPMPYDAAHFLTAEGIDATVAPTTGVRFDGPRATVGDTAVDLIYGCFTYQEAATPRYRGFVDRALRCQRAGGPAYLAPPVFTLLGNKAMLAALDPADWLAPTRLADDRTVRHARHHRADLVIKPAVGYGGRGVVVGRHATPARWATLLDAVAADPRRYVVQDHIAPVGVDLPVPDGRARYELGAGCLVVDGHPAGFLLRYVPAGSTTVGNVSQGAVFAAPCVPPDTPSSPAATGALDRVTAR